ncbi:MAG: hypothetical protein AABN34_11360 [Acidobacteriota bacterium]
MANILNKDKQIAITAALAEGSSIRSIERITGVHRDTIMRLGVRMGQGCAKVLDDKMRDLSCQHLQLDEIWGFIGKKQRNVTFDDDPQQVGDAWTFCAIDSDTKIVPCFKVGKRDRITANAFLLDLASRLNSRTQIATDALAAYSNAIELAFGADVDYGQIVKSFAVDDRGKYTPERKYSPPEIISISKQVINGNPEMARISTSHVERLNATSRLHMRRLNRLTLASQRSWKTLRLRLRFTSRRTISFVATTHCA